MFQQCSNSIKSVILLKIAVRLIWPHAAKTSAETLDDAFKGEEGSQRT